MGSLESDVAAALSSVSEGLTTARQQEILVFIERLYDKALNGELTEDMKDIRRVLESIDTYLTQARPAVSSEQTLLLDPTVSKCLEFILLIIELNQETEEIILCETGILATLASTLKDKYSSAGQIQILKSIEGISRRLRVTWSAPYLTNLIKQVFSLLLSVNPTSNAFLYSLRTITNLVFHNRCCLNVAIRDPSYKLVIKMLISVMTAKQSFELTAMAAHFAYLTEMSVGFTVTTQIKNIKLALADLLSKLKLEKSEESSRKIATGIYHMTCYASTVLTKICNEHKFSARRESCSQDDPEGSADLKSLRKSILKDIIPEFLSFAIDMQQHKNEGVLKSLVYLLTALYPKTMPINFYDFEGMESSLKCLDKTLSSVGSQSKLQPTLLQAYLLFVERLTETSGKPLPENAFQMAIHNCGIVVSASSVDLTRNILTIRILTRLGTLPQFQEKVRKLLNEETMSNLLATLLSCKMDNLPKSVSLRLSTCVVQTLHAISMFFKNPTALMENLQREQTWQHISNCIVNGDEALIAQALALTGTVGFSGKCRVGVSKNLINLREVSVQFNQSTVPNESQSNVSDTSVMAMKKLNDNLKILMDTHQEGNDHAIDDVLGWYKLKNDMHEMEMANMTDHILQLNRTICHLKTLLDKQSELLAKRAASTSDMQKDYRAIQQQLESCQGKKIKLELKHAKAMSSLREQLNYQESLFKTKCERLAELEREVKETKARCAELENSKTEAAQASHQVNEEKMKLQSKLEDVEKDYKTSRQKNSILEKDLKKSEEARKAAESLLEAERRKTEIIQQVLGNRLN